jgi:hypothetical protein
MKNLSLSSKIYILGTILISIGMMACTAVKMDWTNSGLYFLAALGAVAQTLKVEGPNDRTNYSIAWFVYGFAFLLFGTASAVFVLLISHLIEWIWHKYPWYIQSFNIAAHAIPVFLAGWAFNMLSGGTPALDVDSAMGMAVGNLIFVFVNHFLVGVVVKLARGQSFVQSGVFGFLTLFLDFTVLSMGSVTALIWKSSPFAALLNITPLYLLYHALRVPALLRQVQEMKVLRGQVGLHASGD